MQKTIAICLSLFYYQICFAKQHTKLLNFDKIHHYQVSIQENIASLYLTDENRLITTPDTSDYFILTKYYPKNTDSSLAFGAKIAGDVSNSQRIKFHNEIGQGYWRGASSFEKDSLLFLDGKNVRIAAIDKKTNKYISVRDIIVDLIKPAKDSKENP